MLKESRKRAKRAGVPTRCVYCGLPILKPVGEYPPTCKAHDDLPTLDPHYTELAEVA